MRHARSILRSVIATALAMVALPCIAAAQAPVISRMEPTLGAPGTIVVLHGRNFPERASALSVSLGDANVVVRSVTPTEVRVVVPNGASSDRFVVSMQPDTRVQSPMFTVTAALVVTSFEPTSGPPNTAVRIFGNGFAGTAGGNRVTLSGKPVRVQRASSTELTVRIPRGASSGKLRVTVSGRGAAESNGTFIVQDIPAITSFEPTNGPPGRWVMIRGRNFDANVAAMRVFLGPLAAQVRRSTTTDVEVRIPNGATTGTFRVQANGVEGPPSRPFTVLVPVGISSFEPRRGPAGTVVTIRGRGFSPNVAENDVRLGQARAEVLAASAEELRVRLPNASSALLRVVVTGNGNAATNAPFMITTNAGTAEATSTTPAPTASAPTAPVSAEPVSPTAPAAATPAAPTPPSSPIEPTLPATPATTSSPGVVTISGLEPSCTRPGCRVILRGSGFSTQQELNRVFFGSERLQVDAATPTTLEVRLPEEPRTRRFKVDVRNVGLAQSAPFTVER